MCVTHAVARPYQPASDEPVALALWDACVGDRWPVPPAVFRALISEGTTLVLEDGGTTAGLLVAQCNGDRGSILAVLVAPAHRRHGLGRTLVAAAEAELRKQGATDIQLGGGGHSYFWCGVPSDLSGAWAFCQACGWTRQETAFDLVGALPKCTTPPWVWQRVRAVGVTVRRALPSDMEPALRFEHAHFPQWAAHYESVVRSGEGRDMVVAVDGDGEVVGTSGILSPRSAGWRGRFPWPRRLGDDTGGVGALGVAEAQRGKGIGLALAAFVTERLREEGLTHSYVGWTWLVDWYGHLGYRVWQEYVISRKAL